MLARIYICIDCDEIIAAADVPPWMTHEGDVIHVSICNPCRIDAS